MLLQTIKVLFVLTLLNTFISGFVVAKPMPTWSLSNAQNETVNSSDFTGKPLVIHFWATWCPYCKKLQPGLEALKQKYSEQGVAFIAISFREDEGATPQDVLTERGISIPTLINGDSVARDLFDVTGTPNTVFIDYKGKIVGTTRTSDPDDPLLEKATQYLLESYLAEE